MKTIVYKSSEIPSLVYQKVSSLLQDAFAERRAQGIDFKCGTFSPQDVENEFNDGDRLICVYDDDNQIVATVSMLNRRKRHMKYAAHDNLAVASSCKGQGLASVVFKEVMALAKELELDFLSSSTATTATSSVSYHKKKGFLIYQKSFGIGYDSYNYILPLRSMKYLKCNLIRIPLYLLFTAKNKLRFEFKKKRNTI